MNSFHGDEEALPVGDGLDADPDAVDECLAVPDEPAEAEPEADEAGEEPDVPLLPVSLLPLELFKPPPLTQ